MCDSEPGQHCFKNLIDAVVQAHHGEAVVSDQRYPDIHCHLEKNCLPDL